MYCPQCGSRIPEGATSCPSGHEIGPGERPGGRATDALGGAARRGLDHARHVLLRRAPLDIEIVVVSAGLKILAALTALVSLAIWERLNSALAPFGGGVGPLPLVAGIGAGFVLYALGLLVQAVAAAAGRDGA